GDDIVQPVAVDVEYPDLGSPRTCSSSWPPPERDGVIRPWVRRTDVGRLFPPPVRGDDVDAAVTVDVAGTEAVLRHYVVPRPRDVMDVPPAGRVVRIDRRVRYHSVVQDDHIGNAVGIDVGERHDLCRVVERRIAIPPSLLLARIDVHDEVATLADDHVRPTVAGVVESKVPGGRSVVGTRVQDVGDVYFPVRLVVRAEEVVRAGEDVEVAIAVDVGG